MACNCEEAACPRWEHLRQQREEFYHKLEPYPHLFKLSGYDDLNINVYRSIRDRLEAERGQRGAATVMERSRDANLIAFASFQLKDYRSAVTETDSVLEEDGSNLVANADKAIFLWHEGRKDEAEKQLGRLRHWRNQPGFRDKETEGKAEMAYCYSRMGPRCNHLAVQMFEEVVSAKPEVMDWKLGLAMSLRRSTLVNLRMSHHASVDSTMETTERAVELFLEVKDSDASDLTKAQAAAELGLFISKHSLHPKCLHDAHTTMASQCFEQAKRLAPNDVSILNKSGTYYSLNRNLPEARRCLELSILIMPTAQAHEELGAVFQNFAEERKAKAAQQFGPTRTRTRLTPDNEYVQKALQHYRKAIDRSHGEDTTALRKRGYLFKKIGKEEQAFGDFMQLLRPDRSSSSPFNQMLAYQYAGEIRLNQSKEWSRDQENLQKEGIQLLRVAASMWSQLSSRDPKIRDNYPVHDQCFIRLINAIKRDRSLSDVEKAKNEARLLYTMGKPERALSVLRTVKNSETPNEVVIRCYLQNRDFESAVFFLSFLFSTKQLRKLRVSNCHAPVLAYSLAARDKLMTVGNWAGFDLNKVTAQGNFVRAFEYMLPCSPSELQFEGDEANPEDWHVAILHDPLDDDAASKAETVKDVLKVACGLRVTRMSDDVHPGRDEWCGTLHQADKCRLLMVVLGERELSEEFLQAYLGPCFSAPTQEGLSSPQRLVVQTQRCRKLPRTLTGYPSCLCPRELLVDRQKDYFSGAEVDAVCRFFCLMLGVDGLDRYLPS